jgi:hypothetical protein
MVLKMCLGCVSGVSLYVSGVPLYVTAEYIMTLDGNMGKILQQEVIQKNTETIH